MITFLCYPADVCLFLVSTKSLKNCVRQSDMALYCYSDWSLKLGKILMQFACIESSEWPKVHFYIRLKPKAEFLKNLAYAQIPKPKLNVDFFKCLSICRFNLIFTNPSLLKPCKIFNGWLNHFLNPQNSWKKGAGSLWIKKD